MAYMDKEMFGNEYFRIGENIQTIRKTQGKLQKDLCIDTGLCRSKISRIERGEDQSLKIRDLLLIAGALEVSFEQIISVSGYKLSSDEVYDREEKEHLERVIKFARGEFRKIRESLI